MPDGSKRRQIFEAVMAHPPAERRSVLERLCSGLGNLVEDVWAMVKAAEQSAAPGFDPTAIVARAARESAIGTAPGDNIGPYRLVEHIGEGGFGDVWMAHQGGELQRLVALKVLKPGMDSRQVVARFEQERQALALMNHPNIARVFDAGATAEGRPYFVMELVKGLPITEYCEKHDLDLDQRLDLFAQVCRAVQHAHGKGVIHRDIKPRNVLVETHDGRPVVKVIDFGIAKALGQSLTEKSILTAHAAMIGTLEYMSPEQADGALDIDIRTDVYSLGALLYELLTGGPPLSAEDLQQLGWVGLLVALREREPDRPSVRVSKQAMATWKEARASDAGRHRTPPANKRDERAQTAFAGALARDLDWVVMKALEKDRTRRYATADALAEDLRRYREGEAVVAVPPSAWYRARKFMRRNRAVVSASVLVVAAIMAGLVGIALAERRAANAVRALARQERTNTEATEVALRESRVGHYESNVVAAASLIIEGNASAAGERLREAPVECREWEWRHLLWLSDRRTFSYTIDERAAFAAGCSSDGRWIVAGTQGSFSAKQWKPQRMLIWDRQDASAPAALDAFGEFIWDFRSDVKRNRFLPLRHSSMAPVWDVTTGTELGRYGPPNEDIADAAFLSDGKRILLAHEELASLWEIDGQREIVRLIGHKGLMRSVRASKNDLYALTTSTDGTVREWELATGKERSIRGGYGPELSGAEFLLDDQRILILSDGAGTLVDTATNEVLASFERVATGLLRRIVVAPDRLSFVLRGLVPRLIRASDGAILAELPTFSISYSKSGQELIVHIAGALAHVLDAHTGQRLRMTWLGGAGPDIELRAASETEDPLFVGFTPRSVDGWNESDSLISVTLQGNPCGFIGDADISFSCGVVIGGNSHSDDPSAHVWSLENGAEVEQLKWGEYGPQCVATDETGRYLVVAPEGLEIEVWELPTRKRIVQLPTVVPNVDLVAIDGASGRVLWGSSNGEVELWSTRGNLTSVSLAVASREPSCLTFSPSGAFVGVGYDEGVIHVFRSDDASLQATIGVGDARVTALAFNEDDTVLLAGLDDGQALAVELRSQHCVARYAGSLQGVTIAMFGPGPDRVTVAGADVRIFRASTGRELLRTAALEGYTHFVALRYDPSRDRFVGVTERGDLWYFEGQDLRRR